MALKLGSALSGIGRSYLGGDSDFHIPPERLCGEQENQEGNKSVEVLMAMVEAALGPHGLRALAPVCPESSQSKLLLADTVSWAAAAADQSPWFEGPTSCQLDLELSIFLPESTACPESRGCWLYNRLVLVLLGGVRGSLDCSLHCPSQGSH